MSSSRSPSLSSTRTQPNVPGSSFLSFSGPRRIYIATPSRHAPERILLSLQEEGFSTTHLPFDPTNPVPFIQHLKTLHTTFSVSESFALIAYGSAATAALNLGQKPIPRCVALVAYYPTQLPNPNTKFPSLTRVMVHVAGLSQVSAPQEVCEWKCYRYERGGMGFAEENNGDWESVEAGLAWTRTMGCLKAAFKLDVDLEGAAAENWKGKYETEDPDQGALLAVRNMTVSSPHVTILPTLEGAVGRKKLAEFYREFFIPSLVEDFETRLVSRTIGVDRVVDEMVVSFTHTDEIDWMLPGVPPTDKYVEIPVVSIIAFRGGKLVSEHMYWDQASVLMQIGLLDPKLVPKKFKDDGLKKIPTVGVEAAKQLVDPRQQRYNKLLREHGLMDGLEELNAINGA